MNKKLLFSFTIIAGAFFLFEACATYQFRNNYRNANNLLYDQGSLLTKPFLKAHMKNGDVYILKDSWTLDTTTDAINGFAARYDFNRRYMSDGVVTIPVDSVAIFETNTKIVNPEATRIAPLAIMAAVDVVLALYCMANPKACFGSCPTFYINENHNLHYSDAEGFTNAITPSMEYYDIDALNNKPLTDDRFSITMKNEALETHCVKNVKLLAYPRKPGERVYQTRENDFFLCQNTYSISHANAPEGDITLLLSADDKIERFSLSDSTHLNSKEEIVLSFDEVTDHDDLGLVIHYRQTLMTTWLFYQAMGFMGNEVGDMFAKLEREEDLRNNFDATTKMLGGIEVFLWNSKTEHWVYQGCVDETGPIAINRQLITFTNVGPGSNKKIKLRLNKGLWRIDYLALTNRIEKVEPLEITASAAFYKGTENKTALDKLHDPDQYIISMPGCEYRFDFTLPEEETDYELFLYSEGYYLEWMRKQWLGDKDLLKLRQMVYNPKAFLRAEAANFKRYESTMEEQFWNSKIDTKYFSDYED